jgi:uncharacterized protein (TIGR02271 family)
MTNFDRHSDLPTQRLSPQEPPLSADEHDVMLDRQTLELREEELIAHKERVESGAVNVRKITEEVPSRLEVDAVRDEVEVEHVPIGQVVAERVAAREEGGLWIIPVYEEQLVVVKRLVLREEIRVRRIPVREQRVIQETVRRDRLEIDGQGLTERVHERYPTEPAEEGEKPSLLERMGRKVLE